MAAKKKTVKKAKKTKKAAKRNGTVTRRVSRKTAAHNVVSDAPASMAEVPGGFGGADDTYDDSSFNPQN